MVYDSPDLVKDIRIRNSANKVQLTRIDSFFLRDLKCLDNCTNPGLLQSLKHGMPRYSAACLAKAAQVFSVPLDFFLSDEPRRELDSIRINRAAIPILGNIACGQRVTPDTNPEGYADLPEGVTADFALRCKGDSMEPTFIDGDIVLIRRQPEVEAGQIAAVSIAGETTLKHVYRQKDGLLLVADNPSYSPIFAPANSDEQIIIHGLAVGYTRIFK